MTPPLNPYFENVSELPRPAAIRLLEEAGIDSIPVDLVRLMKRQDWRLSFEDFGDPEVKRRDGRFEKDGNKQITVFVNTDRYSTKGRFSDTPTELVRQRFTIAHELGHAHFTTHNRKDLQDSLSDDRNPHSRTYRYAREAQANQFASELLIPQWHLQEQLTSFDWDRFFPSVEDLQYVYEISLLACASRLAKEAPFAAMLLHFNSDGKLANTPACSRDHADVRFFFPYGDKIPKRTLVDDLANNPDFDNWCRKQSDCSNWFPGDKNANRFSLVEQAKRVGKYGFLVFLSFDYKEQEY